MLSRIGIKAIKKRNIEKFNKFLKMSFGLMAVFLFTVILALTGQHRQYYDRDYHRHYESEHHIHFLGFFYFIWNLCNVILYLKSNKAESQIRRNWANSHSAGVGSELESL
mmetsp:Transcript_658/g.607  ORF Transcript_658/g.607 Transcript_658/m.607 type:complete len:110 (+) Transcript_658:615-944(+)